MSKPADYNEIQQRVTRLCADAGLDLHAFPVPEIELDLLRVRIPSAAASSRRVFLGTGVHGDEPAAVTAVLQFLEERRWERYPRLSFTIFPCVNPNGYDLGIRENAAGDDVNRSFHGEGTPESRAMRRVLEGDNFDYWIDAHEDYAEDGYYMFAPTDTTWAADIARAVGQVGPINIKPEIDEMPILDGIVQFEGAVRDRFEERTDWPMAYYLIKNFSERGFTPETPGLKPLDLRVVMQLAAYDAALTMLSDEAAAG
jgi:predicted deacylase